MEELEVHIYLKQPGGDVYRIVDTFRFTPQQWDALSADWNDFAKTSVSNTSRIKGGTYACKAFRTEAGGYTDHKILLNFEDVAFIG